MYLNSDYILFLGAGAGSGTGSGNCETVGGPDIGKPCIFPAIFNGVSYTECGMDPPRCATEVHVCKGYNDGKIFNTMTPG